MHFDFYSMHSKQFKSGTLVSLTFNDHYIGGIEEGVEMDEMMVHGCNQ